MESENIITFDVTWLYFFYNLLEFLTPLDCDGSCMVYTLPYKSEDVQGKGVLALECRTRGQLVSPAQGGLGIRILMIQCKCVYTWIYIF